jgi:hypothetical protein
MKRTLVRFFPALLAAVAWGATSGGGTSAGGGVSTGSGASPAPAGSPAAPGASQGTVASPPVTGAATPLNPNAPPPGAMTNPSPAQTQPVTGAATPLSPNTPVPGAPSGLPSNATLGAPSRAIAPPVAGQVPTATIAEEIQNPLVTTQAGSSSSGQTAQTAAGQNTLPTLSGQTGSPSLVPGAAPPLNVQNLGVVRLNGALILTGTVHSQADKDAAGLRASAASGGETVINNIVVQ